MTREVVARSVFSALLLSFTLIMAVFFTPGPCPAQTIVQNFPGLTLNDAYALNSNFGRAAPDPTGAVGLTQFVEFVNGAFAVYSKTGVQQTRISDNQFWLNAGIPAATLSAGIMEPRVVYDAASGRWIAVERTMDNTGNKLLLARSNTSDPTGSWKAVSFTANSGNADLPTLACDATGVYMATNNFTSPTGSLTGMSIFSVPKADLLASTPSLARMTKFENLNADVYGFTLQGVANDSAGPGHGVIVAMDNSRAKVLDRTTINGSGAAGATLSSPVYVNHQYDAWPNAVQQPGLTQVMNGTGDQFSASVRQVGNHIYTANTIQYGSRNAVHWLVLDEPTNTVVSEGLISDPSYDFFQPSIAANADGTIMLGFNRCGAIAPAGNISSYAAIGTDNGTSITFGTPFVLTQGTISNYSISWETGTPKNWGHYSATMVDPADPNVFWTLQEIPFESQVWGTQITAVSTFTPPTSKWNGGASGDDSWTAAANWNGTPPAAGDCLQFGVLAAGGHATNNNDLPAGTRFSSVTFLAGAPAYTLQGNAIGLDGAVINQSSSDQSISLGIDIGPNGISVDTGAKSMTLAGPISGAGAISKAGAGSLVLTGMNSYAGNTNINGGTLKISSDDNLGAGDSLTFNGGTLQTVGATGITSGRTITLYAGGGTFHTNGLDSALSGPINGAGGLTKAGGGTLTLVGTKSFTGRTTISSGAFRLGDETTENGSVGGDIVNNASLVFANPSAQTFSGAISGTGGLAKTGAGVLTLTGVSGYSGPTVILSGTLQLGSPPLELPSVSGAGISLQRWYDATDLTNGGANPANGATVSTWYDKSGNGKNATARGAPTYAAAAINGKSAVTLGSGKCFSFDMTGLAVGSSPSTMFVVGKLTSQPSTWNWMVTYGYSQGAGARGIGVNYGSQLNYTAMWFDVAGPVLNVNAPVVADAIFGGPSGNSVVGYYSLNGSSGSVAMNPALNTLSDSGWIGRQSGIYDEYWLGQVGEVILYNGALTDGQRQQVEAYLNYKWLGVSTSNLLPITTPVQIDTGAVLDLNGTSQQVASLADHTPGSPGTVTNTSATMATLTLGGASGTATFSGAISGPIRLVKSGGSTQVLSGNNTYTGGTTITAGVLRLGTAAALPSGSVTVNGTLDLGNSDATIPELSGRGTIDKQSAETPNNRLLVDSGAFDGTIRNTQGTLGLTKTGSGTLTLSGTNAYSGDTVISGGTLKMASPFQTLGLAHRWSFNNSLIDSVGGSNARTYGNTVLGANQVTINGNGTQHVSYVDLGPNILPRTNSPTTIELWATENQLQNWSRVFDFGNSAGGTGTLLWSWTQGTSNPSVISPASANFNAASFAVGMQYHIALVLTPNGSITSLNWYQMDSSGNVLGSGSNSPNWSLSQMTQTNMWLGRSEYFDNDANASYNEVRIWNSALTQAQLSTLSVLGPDAVFDVTNVLPATTAVSIASGAMLDLNGSNQTIGSLAGDAGSQVLLGRGKLTAGGNNADTSFAGTISGTGGSVIKTGAGTMVVSGANSYSGGTTIAAGTLLVTGTGSLPGWSTASKVSVSPGATLAVRAAGASGSWTAENITTLMATSPFSSGSYVGVDVDPDITFTYVNDFGVGQMNKGLIKSGAGTLVLSGGSNTYTGGTRVNGGALVIAGPDALPIGRSLTISAGGTVVLASGLSAAGAGTAGTTAAPANAVPEPDTMVLLGAGGVALLLVTWWRRRITA